MKKILLFVLPVVLAILVFAGIVFFLQRSDQGKGALQVTAQPQSMVFLNGKEIGKSPFCKCDPKTMLPTGEYTIRLVPVTEGYQQYEEKITITQSVLTVVDRTFGDMGKSYGSVISLVPITDKKNAQIFVSSFPYGADVSLDSNVAGNTPVLIEHVTDSDHELTVSKTGYKEKTIPIHGVMGYKLHAIISLATDTSPVVALPGSSPSAQPSATSSPGPSPANALTGQSILILDTPTGFLRVRDSASLGGQEVARVNPGETYPYVSEQTGWYQIKLTSGKTGWVSASYVKKQ